MFIFVLSGILVLASLVLFIGGKKILNFPYARAIPLTMFVVGAFLQATVHFVNPGGSQIVLLDKVFGGGSLQDGRLIATTGERGLQAETLPPGFQFKPFVGVFFRTDTISYTEIPEGHYGLVSAKDGLALEEGAVIAPPVPVELFLDAKGFMDGAEINGQEFRGTKGQQTTILRPGKYPINTHLFNVTVSELTQATVVPNGSVAVIKSAVNEGRRPADMPTNPGQPVDCSMTE